jgi:hypothetical protein
MDHEKAVSDRSVERYLLEEMSTVEVEEFEHHYFECQECASDIEATGIFIANARAVMAEADAEPLRDAAPGKDASPEPRESFWDSVTAWWTKPGFVFPSVAALVLGALSLYQGVVIIPGLREARILPAFQLTGASRGEAARVAVASGTPFVFLAIDIPPDSHFPEYWCELSAGGRAVFRLRSPAPVAGEAITLLAPTAKLRASQMEVRIYGANAAGEQLALVSTFAFEVQFH